MVRLSCWICREAGIGRHRDTPEIDEIEPRLLAVMLSLSCNMSWCQLCVLGLQVSEGEQHTSRPTSSMLIQTLFKLRRTI